MEISKTITDTEIKKIFPNIEMKKKYLEELYKNKKIYKQSAKTNKEINQRIVETWDYEISKKIIRELFKETDKYKNSKESNKLLKEALKEWKENNLGDIKWPFQALGFDNYIQQINCRNITEEEKDILVKEDIVKYRRIKKINTYRNDFIEYLIVENNSNIIPTLKHSRGVDFYINGYPYDQKVSKSVTKQFKDNYGEIWRDIAIKKPEIVAEYLYKYQDDQRFGYEPRLLVVNIDENIDNEDIIKCVKKVDFQKTIKLKFKYTHPNNIVKDYTTECYIILLYKH